MSKLGRILALSAISFFMTCSSPSSRNTSLLITSQNHQPYTLSQTPFQYRISFSDGNDCTTYSVSKEDAQDALRFMNLTAPQHAAYFEMLLQDEKDRISDEDKTRITPCIERILFSMDQNSDRFIENQDILRLLLKPSTINSIKKEADKILDILSSNP